MKNNSIFSFILIATLCLASACDTEEVSCIKDCQEAFLAEHDMVSYKGEEVGCKYFLALYEYKNKQYYLLNNHCTDMAPYPADCNGNRLCEEGESNTCNDFFEDAKYIGIVGIKP